VQGAVGLGQMQLTLAAKFLQYFDIAYVVTEAQRHDVFGIRYSVYCDEFGYEPVHLFPDHEERDEFDSNAIHVLITHKTSGTPAGCVRLVTPIGSKGSDLLPFEKHCESSLDTEFIRSLNLDRGTVCEISRLAVDGPFRRRAGEKVTRYGEVEGMDWTKQERRTFSMIAVACFLAATALTDLTGRTNVFAMMEPFLPRLLKRSGIEFQRAGKDIDYHGLRAPYFITTQSAVENMRADLKELYCEIYRIIQQDYSG